MIFDVDEADFEQQVVERSRRAPVVVDFWASWCGPCRQLGPALEAEASRREGEVDLAKVDVDANGALAARFGIQGIPAVKAFRDGAVVSEFTGALPPTRVAAFFDGLVPSRADRLAASGDEGDLREALELDPRHAGAATALARILLARGEPEEAAELLAPFESDFLAAGLRARARLAAGAGGEKGPARAFAAWDEGRYQDALDALQQEVVAAGDGDRRDALRQVMVAIFTELGPESELARSHRRRLALALT